MTTKLQQLRLQAEELAAQIAAEEEAAAATAFTKIEKIINESGITLDQLAEHFGIHSSPAKPKKQKDGGSTGSRKPAEAKYALLSDPTITWSGRGLLPRPFQAAINADPKLTKESFLIKK